MRFDTYIQSIQNNLQRGSERTHLFKSTLINLPLTLKTITPSLDRPAAREQYQSRPIWGSKKLNNP